jgi:LPXTG-site transpeptidase (sortase) family protein
MKHSFKNVFLTALTLLVLTFGAVGVTPAYAADNYVTNCNDSGAAGSLRQVIAAAASGDTVKITMDCNITLTSTLNINKNLTISGFGYNVTISGNNLYSVFTMVGSATTFTLRYITIANGKTDTGGGAITYMEDTASSGGTLNVNNVTFSGNSARLGGAIYLAGVSGKVTTANVSNSTFSGNSANYTDPSLAFGGAIYLIDYSTLNVTNSTFSGNSAPASAPTGSSIENNGGKVTLKNTIIANHGTGTAANCYHDAQYPSNDWTDGGGNLEDGNTCGFTSGTSKTNTNPLLGNLDYYPSTADTKTFKLLNGSPAIDAGVSATCSAVPVSGKDQRDMTRPTACDIGAFEMEYPQVELSNSSPADGAILTIGVATLKVEFSKDVSVYQQTNADFWGNSVTNPDNYLLVKAGVDSAFHTLTCSAGWVADDTKVTVNSVSYVNTDGIYTATLNVNSGVALPGGKYKLFVCGTTSITDVDGQKINGGLSDETLSFTVQSSTSGVTKEATAVTLPKSGFAPGEVSVLPKQPASKAYQATVLALHIPTLGVEATITGVPRSGDSWDVSWLGSSAGYLYGSAYPTWVGNSVLTGHVWDAYNNPGIFAELKSLKYGDQIHIHAYGQTYIYEVRSSKLVSKFSVPSIFKSEELSWVTLLTCESFNPSSETYLFRRAVRAVLVKVE